MQDIQGIPDDYRLTKWFQPIYEAYSVTRFPAALNVPDSVRAILNKLHRKAGVKPLGGGAGVLPQLQLNRHADGKKRAFISFAGGKDALAVAIRAAEDGYVPTLFYIQGVNKVVPSERTASEACAKMAGFPLVERKINIKGTKDFGEHPLKNVFILCMLIDEGIKQGATAFGQGNIFEEDSTHSILDDCLSDAYDILRDFCRVFRQMLPQFVHLQYLHDNLQAFYTVWKYNKNIIPLLSTCNTGDFRRPMRRKYIAEHFGAGVLSAKGCGGCYKCAMEYNNKVKFGMIPHPNTKYQIFGTKLINDFKRTHNKTFRPPVGFNRYGGRDTAAVQVMEDPCGFYIGRLEYEPQVGKWFSRDFFGHQHYSTRERAEQVCKRFKSLYRLE